MEITAIGQRLKIRLPVEADVHSIDNEIKLPLTGLSVPADRGYSPLYRYPSPVLPALSPDLELKAVTLASHCVQKFYSDMPQPANTNYPNAAGSSDMVHQQWFKDRDTAAQQRPGGLDINIFSGSGITHCQSARNFGKATAIHNRRHRPCSQLI